MSSSGRTAVPVNAVLYQQDRATGGMVLPERDSDAFVAEFNRTYRSIGLVLVDGVVIKLPTAEPEKKSPHAS